MQNKSEIKVGISSCLLGEKVRFDGQHKKDNLILSLLGPHVEWVSICPEVEAGMSIPREPIRLVSNGKNVSLQTVKGAIDVTDQIANYSEKKMRQIKRLGLSGYILKKGSPSCGMERVKCYGKSGQPTNDGQGIFAKSLLNTFTLLPVEEEGRLLDSVIRENFVERLFGYHRLNAFFSTSWSIGTLILFHTAHKIQLLAHSPEDYKLLGKTVAEAKKNSKSEIEKSYSTLFMKALKKTATPGKNTNSLEHMAGFFKEQLSSDEKKELATIFKDYRTGLVPLVVPITMIQHYVYKFSIDYLKGQTFLNPNPKELMLRNHV